MQETQLFSEHRHAEAPEQSSVITIKITNANATRRKLIISAETPASDIKRMNKPILPHKHPARSSCSETDAGSQASARCGAAKLAV